MTKETFERAQYLHSQLRWMERELEHWSNAQWSELSGMSLKTFSVDVPLRWTKKEFEKFKKSQVDRLEKVKANMQADLESL
jgi:hypothetical protein